MVYQEQVMQAAQYCAGYSLGGADLLRRAMGKKKPEEMVKQRQIFTEGAAKKILMKPLPTISLTIWKSSQVMALTNHMPQLMP
jgi:DNA polymerase III alpha subunit